MNTTPPLFGAIVVGSEKSFPLWQCNSICDAFCGFKAYSRRALEHLHINETGYAMPLEVWVQAAAASLRIVELPVPLVYLDLARSFGGALDDAATRLAYYRSVLDRAEAAVAATAPGTAT